MVASFDPRGAMMVFRHLPDALLVVDGQGRLVALNPAAESLFQLDPAQVLGRRVGELEAWMRGRGRGGVPVEVAVAPIPHERPDEPALVLCAREAGSRGAGRSLADLTGMAAQRSQAALAEAQRRLRSPLCALEACCRQLEGEGDLPWSAHEPLKRLREAVLHIHALAERLDSLALPPEDWPLALGPVILPSWVHKAVSLVEVLARQREVTLEVRPLPALAVRGDERWLGQILLELLVFMLEAQERGARLRLEAHLEGERVCLSLWDDAWEAHPGSSHAPPGGAGPVEELALAQALLQAMEGELGMERSPQGKGRRLWIRVSCG